jgi:hypothetical protein
METNFGIHTQSDSATIHSFHKAGNRHSQQAMIEARLRQLGKQVEGMNSDSRLVWLQSGPHIYDCEFDLSVKVEAVRWMLRIAKHMRDSAREMMFFRIQNSLQQLERTLQASEWSGVT